MTGSPLHELPDSELEVALRALSETVAWPTAVGAPGGPDLAVRVRARIAAAPAAPVAPRRWSWRPARRAVVLALVGLVAVAAVAAAVGLGVPGIRLIFGEPAVTPPPATEGPSRPRGQPGAGIGLGAAVPIEALDERAGFPVHLPTDPGLPAPDAAYINAQDQVSLVWAAGGDLPPTADPQIGLVVTQFRARMHPDAPTKAIREGTTIERLTVDGQAGFWISGDVHLFFYDGPDGEVIEESRRWVGDALIWSDGEMTYRIETSLGRDAALRIAESLRLQGKPSAVLPQ